MEARIVPGPKPSAMDSMIEADRRGYGQAQADAFSQGVILTNVGRPNVETGVRRRKWIDAGMKWATEEAARRAEKEIN
jgi:hypothetical protein